MAAYSKWLVFHAPSPRSDLRALPITCMRESRDWRRFKPTYTLIARLSRLFIESQVVSARLSDLRCLKKTVALQRRIMSSASPQSSSSPPQQRSKGADVGFVSDANIRNFAPVARIMKMALPENAKIAKEAKECMQECVSEFISFITSEGSFPCKTQDKTIRLSC